MKVLIFLAKGVEILEAAALIDVLGWSKHYCNSSIDLVTCGITREIRSTFNVGMQVDLLIDDVVVDEYEALAIPGGFGDYGFYDDAYDERFLELVRRFDSAGKLIASICVGALPLGKSGVLTGRKATTYNLSDSIRQQQLEAFGVTVIDAPIVFDANIITSSCPFTATEVAFTLLELLTSPEVAKETRAIMGF